jgi:hypothetical protein
MTRVVGATSGAMEFGLDANRTGVQVGSKRKLGDTNRIPMEIRDATRMCMGKTMMPENACLIAGEMFDHIFSWGRGKHQVGKGGYSNRHVRGGNSRQ